VTVSDVVSYSVADPSLATLSQVPALATSVKVGTTELVARLGALETAPASLTISDSQPTAFHIGFDEALMRVGETQHVPAIATFDVFRITTSRREPRSKVQIPKLLL
jgi:hypothetical protein